MDELELFNRGTRHAREKFLDPAVERALKEMPGPLPPPPLIFAQFLAALEAISGLYPKAIDRETRRANVLELYKNLSEFAIRKYLVLNNLDENGHPEGGS